MLTFSEAASLPIEIWWPRPLTPAARCPFGLAAVLMGSPNPHGSHQPGQQPVLGGLDSEYRARGHCRPLRHSVSYSASGIETHRVPGGRNWCKGPTSTGHATFSPVVHPSLRLVPRSMTRHRPGPPWLGVPQCQRGRARSCSRRGGSCRRGRVATAVGFMPRAPTYPGYPSPSSR